MINNNKMKIYKIVLFICLIMLVKNLKMKNIEIKSVKNSLINKEIKDDNKIS